MIILIPIGIWMQKQSRERGKSHFKAFYSAEIDSQIESVRIAYKGTGMKLSDGREFVFYPYTDKVLNAGNIFNQTAKNGDLVLKTAHSDTLYLIKENVKLAYTFQKF